MMQRRTEMSASPVDPDRFADAWEANQEVLERLVENGDRPEIPRPIDLSFRGSAEALQRLADAAEDFGFSVMEDEPSEDGEPCLFLERLQTAEWEAVRNLTMTYLQIEDLFGVECDGWGCVAQTGLIH
jgi:regulator of RNase E activity RraB